MPVFLFILMLSVLTAKVFIFYVEEKDVDTPEVYITLSY